MKRKLVENTPVPDTTRPEREWWVEVQMVQNILVLNTYHKGVLYARHAVNPETKEHETLKDGRWSQTQLPEALKASTWWYCSDELDRFCTTDEGEETIRRVLKIHSCETGCWLAREIIWEEQGWDADRREEKEKRRMDRLDKKMALIQKPGDLEQFAEQKLTGGKHWMLKDADKGVWNCTACQNSVTGKELRKENKKLPDGGIIICPHCKREVEYRSRKQEIIERAYITVIQPVNDEFAAATHYLATAYAAHRKSVTIQGSTRIIMHKADVFKRACDIYYRQWCRWDRRNPENCRTGSGYLYDAGITEAFSKTFYEPWCRLFTQMAAAGQKANYNRLMAAAGNNRVVTVFEMLFRGRFYNLLCEQSENISLWSYEYSGILRLAGNTMENVFGITDKQMINRIRDRNGKSLLLEWMQWNCRHAGKIPDKVLDWLEENNIRPKDLTWPLCRMTPEKTMNYIERQRKESYKGYKAKAVASQYTDYMNMCQKLKKDTSDEMVYRPRELKRRHDECVLEIERNEASIQAEEYSGKYPEAESVLREIREKLSFTGDEYFIKVPEKIIDIVLEGRFLHHCVGSTDRYFDRIKDHETYICFLRKTAEPDTPFYTIEVEPGGTIRQHRGMYDEEPELDKVKPFLRIWQQEIRKRMKAEDHEREARSAILREKNIKELEERNNTRVLQSLREDFMAAVG